MLSDREPVVVVLDGRVPHNGLAVDPYGRVVYRDGRRVGKLVGYSSLSDVSPHGWLNIDFDKD